MGQHVHRVVEPGLGARAIGLAGASVAGPGLDGDPLDEDRLAEDGSRFGLVDSWRDAGRPVEFHLYEQGGHGFGMYDKTTTSTGWFEAFVSWMRMHGWLEPRR